MCVSVLSQVQLFATPGNVAHQVPLSMGFSRQEYWSGLPFPSPEDLPDPGIKLRSPALKADSLPFELQGSLRSSLICSKKGTPNHQVCKVKSNQLSSSSLPSTF